MRLTIREKAWDHDPAATVELPKGASASIFTTGDFATVQLNGITPAQLHDAIGCTATGRKPCADCDSGAEDIPPHDCTRYAKEEAR